MKLLLVLAPRALVCLVAAGLMVLSGFAVGAETPYILMELLK